jgi:hypothetical protein
MITRAILATPVGKVLSRAVTEVYTARINYLRISTLRSVRSVRAVLCRGSSHEMERPMVQHLGKGVASLISHNPSKPR